MTALYKGLTWDHPRGFNALDRAGRESGLIQWDKQPLEGFESAPIGDLCAEYDLVVLDHPHLGEALALGCLQPLELVFDAEDLARIARATIGACFRSYTMNGQQWGLPLDAATQVMAWRPELVDQSVETWQDVTEYARRSGKVALSLAGPHAFLSLLSIAASLDGSLDLGDCGWLSSDLCERAFEQLAEVQAFANTATQNLNPIEILETMSSDTAIAVCPLIYGYVNYSARPAQASVAFRDAPRADPGGRIGSILGGTGIGISTRSPVDNALRDHLLWLMDDAAQSEFMPANDGQPSARAAWQASGVNEGVRDFYKATSQTLEQATLRPRHNGYIAFQSAASRAVRDALAARENAALVAHNLSDMFDASLPRTGKETA